MKKTKQLLCIFLAILLLAALPTLSSCGAGENSSDMDILDGGGDLMGGMSDITMDGTNGAIVPPSSEKEDAGTDFLENPFINTALSPVSTFSADVDTASYAYFRKLVNSNYTLEQLIAQGGSSIRTEEMVNYFDYDYALPSAGEIFGKTATIAKSPWNDSTHLMILGLTTEAPVTKGSNNLVFLIDVSGSMAAEDKLPLLKTGFSYLVSALNENDTVSIVTYSGKEAVILDGCAGNRDEEIMNAINSLRASGSTNGESGLQKAYELAAKHFHAGKNNRIIMASDGDLNVGISSPEELKSFISEKRDLGIYLSVLGFGTGNYRDSSMSALAQNGNGVYYYIDSDREAEKVLGTELLSTLYTVARDVKFQLTFDAEYVSEYRLIGYENRLLDDEDFDDDSKDAGEVGAGHTLTVCYELKLSEKALSAEGIVSEWMKLAMRYKLLGETDSTLREYGLGGSLLTDDPSDDFQFISAVIETAMILHSSEYNVKGIGIENVFTVLSDLELSSDEYKEEFRSLIENLIEKLK